MANKCTYNYKGYNYDREDMLFLIKNGYLQGDVNQQKSIEWLKRNLGMNESQIEFVSGLIDDKSYGRLLEDGNILLSDIMEIGTEYHEAFHRIWRFHLSEQERNEILEEAKLDNSINLKEVKKLYPDKTLDEQYEEYFAEEFRDFVLHEGNYTTTPKRYSAFERILNFIKKLLGINTKKLNKKELYSNIINAKYVNKFSKDSPYYGQIADKRLSSNTFDFSMAEKNEILDSILVSTLQMIFEENTIYDILKQIENNNSTLLNDYFVESVIDTLELALSTASEKNNKDLENRLNALILDSILDINGENVLNPKSILFELLSDHFRTFNIKLNFQQVEDFDDINLLEENNLKDSATYKPSIQFDPNMNMSKAIKLMLASVNDSNLSENLGLFKQIPWNNVAKTITQELASLPNDIDLYMQKLSELSSKDKTSYISQIIEMLGGVEYDYTTHSHEKNRLRLEFAQTFAKNKYNFTNIRVQGGDIYPIDANHQSVVDKIIRQWDANFKVKYNSSEELENDLKGLNKASDIAEMLGLKEYSNENSDLFSNTINEAGKIKTVSQKIFDLKDAILEGISKKDKQGKEKKEEEIVPYDKIFSYLKGPKKKYNVRTTLTNLADIISFTQDPVNLQVFNAEKKKIYNISLNTYQTIIINELNYIAGLYEGEPQYVEERLEVLKDRLPHLVNINTFKEENGNLIPTSHWIRNILEGNGIKLHIIDGVISPGEEGISFSDLSEADLLAFTINSTLKGVNLSMKHSDRSTFYAYGFNDNSLLVDTIEASSSINTGVEYLAGYLEDEIRRIKALREGNGSEIARFNKNGLQLTIFSFLKDMKMMSENSINNMIESENPTEYINTKVKKHLKKFIEEEVRNLKNQFDKWKLNIQLGGNYLGLSKDLQEKFSEAKDDVLTAALTNMTVNSLVNHIEETKVLIGDLAFYKDADDSYKRFSMQSSTGEVVFTGEKVNNWVANRNSKDKANVYNPTTNEIDEFYYNKPTDGSMSEIILEEFEDYISTLHSSGELEKIFTEGLKNSTDLTEDQIAKQVKAYLSAYERVNENDGQSYLNIFSWREMMYRAGKWNSNLENTFQLELAVASLSSKDQLADLDIYVKTYEVNGVTEYALSANEKEGYTKQKAFELPNFFGGVIEAGAIIKPQYTGPMYRESLSQYKNIDPMSRFNIIAGRKTSYMVLFPSVVLGTQLQRMSSFTLRTGTDAIHLGSAAKYGHIDAKSVATVEHIKENGAQFYNENGEFNDVALEQDIYMLTSYLDFKYMKHQLNIHNKPKTQIKNSTQSAKIIVSNLLIDGVPRDVSKEEWDKLITEEDKRNASEIYDLVSDYKQTLSEVLSKKQKELLKELNVLEKTPEIIKLVEVIQNEAIARNEPINIIESIDKFLETKTIETLPNKNKIENILYSIVSNNVIKFKRPGNSVPQIASTGFESKPRVFDNGKILSNQDAVKFYEVREDGGLKPAEAIMPFPRNLLPQLLKISGETNIVKAIEWINNRINPEFEDLYGTEWQEAVTWKTLRIPNQQLGSNGVYRIKEFKLPTLESYIIVPSENVVKTGGDFDIDKLSVYMMTLNDEMTAEESLSNKLLKIENKILLHPSNAHILLAPLVDDILSKEAVETIITNLKRETLDKTKHYQSVGVWKNILKTIHYVGGKFGVGQVATMITGHSVAMVDNVELSNNYVDGKKGLKKPFEKQRLVSTKLPFKGMQDNTLTRMLDNDGNNIMEVLSALITSQVDVGKNPYPVELGINNQTLNVLTYLIRRGVPVITALHFIAQPGIVHYLEQQRINESKIRIYKGYNELKKDELIRRIIADLGGNYNEYVRDRKSIENGESEILWTIEEMEKGIISKDKKEKNQAKLLTTFLHLVDQVKIFSKYERDLTPDTKSLKDINAVEEVNDNYDQLLNSGIIKNTLSYRQGVLNPFFTSREMYTSLFNNFYITRQLENSDQLSEIRNTLVGIQKTEEKKVKVRNLVDNDFILYALQNTIDNRFDELFKGNNSLARRILNIKSDKNHPLNQNYAIQELIPLLENVKDDLGGKISNFLIYDRSLNTVQLNDIHDALNEISEQDVQLYNDIVIANFYQAGINNSAYSISKVLPVELRFELLEQAIDFIQSNKYNLNNFFEKFLLNHPDILPSSAKQAFVNKIPFYKKYDVDNGVWQIISLKGDNMAKLGSWSYKRYQDESDITESNQEIIENTLKELEEIRGESGGIIEENTWGVNYNIDIANGNMDSYTDINSVIEMKEQASQEMQDRYAFDEDQAQAIAEKISNGELNCKKSKQ